MYVCMYVCMYACMHACMHVYIYIYIYKQCSQEKEVKEKLFNIMLVKHLMKNLCKYSFFGTEAHEKLKGVLTNTRIVNYIRKLSPIDQTSCLEVFHATLNHWQPKMLVFSWMETHFRYCTYKIICRCTLFLPDRI